MQDRSLGIDQQGRRILHKLGRNKDKAIMDALGLIGPDGYAFLNIGGLGKRQPEILESLWIIMRGQNPGDIRRETIKNKNKRLPFGLT
jgi:hypothetical protein